MKYSLRTLITILTIVTCSMTGLSQHDEISTRSEAITPDLVTPEPIDNARRLYAFLKDSYTRKIISGVMTLNSMDDVNWLKTNTGKEPAIVGLDFMHCNRGYDWYNDEEPINDARTYYNRNGIPVFCWHWRDPLRTTEEFYSNGTSFDVSKIFDTASPEYAAMINDIDYVSGLLKILHNENIPVIWRPLHEAAGGWFWWGEKGAAACKELYQVMYNRMVNHHGLKNLIWVWTHEPNDNEWYPGDEYVDIVSRDIYRDGDHSSQITEYTRLVNVHTGRKIVALSETGSFPDVDNLVKDRAYWSWWMPWYGKYTRDAAYNPLSLWEKMFAHDYVITLDEMPDLKTYESPVITNLENGLSNHVRIFPTLVIDRKVTIEAQGLIGTVTIHNSMGKEVYRLSSDRAYETLTLPLTSGLYFVKMQRSFNVTKIVLK